MPSHSDCLSTMFWADINPKRGSFEDFICSLSQNMKESGMPMFFVLGQRISPKISKLFNEIGVEHYLSPHNPVDRFLFLRKLIILKRPKVGHFHFIGLADPLILSAKIIGLKKIILTDHMSPLILAHSDHGRYESIKKIKRRFITSRIDSIIAGSNFVKSRLTHQEEVRDIPVKTIYYGVDLKRFCPAGDAMEKASLKKHYFSIERDIKVVTYVGQLTKEKGIIPLLEAIRQLDDVNNNIHIQFVIVGEGPLSGEIIRCVNKLGHAKFIFLGKREDVEDIMRASDILVVPSLWYEAFGIVAAEAAASGVPVIASKIGGLQEAVSHNKSGLLVAPGNSKAISDAIFSLLANPEVYRDLSIGARRHAEEHFDMQNIVRETVAHYLELLQDTASHPLG